MASLLSNVTAHVANFKISGLLVSPYDVQIAGTALAYNLTMVTSNLKEFRRIVEIQIEDWRT